MVTPAAWFCLLPGSRGWATLPDPHRVGAYQSKPAGRPALSGAGGNFVPFFDSHIG